LPAGVGTKLDSLFHHGGSAQDRRQAVFELPH